MNRLNVQASALNCCKALMLLGDDNNEGVLINILPDTLTKPSKLSIDVKEVVLFPKTVLVDLIPLSPAQDVHSKITKAIVEPVNFVNDEDIYFPYVSSKTISNMFNQN